MRVLEFLKIKRMRSRGVGLLTLTLLSIPIDFQLVHASKVPVDPGAPYAKPAMPVRVRLTDDTRRVEVRGFDLRLHERVPGVEAKSPASWMRSHSSPRLSQWLLTCRGSRVEARKVDLPNAKQSASNGPDIEVVPRGKLKEPETLSLKSPVMIRTPAGFLSYSGRPYREEIRVYSKGKTCEVLNVVDLEKYLDGLVNSEFSASWSEEAIAAQVVAARTYAVYQMKQARSRPGSTYDLDASVRDQVYDGTYREDYRSSRAVDRTRGFVLLAKNGSRLEAIKAFYHSTCGGETELPLEVWGKPFVGFKRRVKCPYCASSPRFEWSTQFSTDEIARAIQDGAERQGAPRGWPRGWRKQIEGGKLVGILIHPEVGGKRVGHMLTFWKPKNVGGTQITLPLSGALFRSWIGALRVRSTAFRVEPVGQGKDGGPTGFRFVGNGNGHGVGMCQWGAKVMGERGYTMSSILSHYYPGAVTRRIW